MESAEWQRVKVLFDAALQREPSQRSAFLDEACVGAPGLRAEVVSLLASYEGAGSFIEPPHADCTPKHSPERPAEPMRPGRVGPYQLLRQIGHGGMGTVYLATRADEQYQKRVAVKVVRAGAETREIVRRVQQERQMLAALDHPNIVKLLDGGTTEEGLPFLVMDYVEGTPIDQYCDVHRLSTTERLQLFLNVCAAVQYAHQNLVVHRDLKPSNIIVTPAGVPKLLDFGIAKLLKPEFSPLAVAVTQTAERPMTLEYASPEQIRGEPITTATDVYALGVVLYELLTAHSPYRVKTSAPLELERAICEQEPEKPSTAVTRVEELEELEGPALPPLTPNVIREVRDGNPEKLQKRLSGDLDMIVLMALRKEPQRRYASVEQFAEDVRRHLSGLPVRARKDTVGYRTSKFLTRHKVGVSAAVLVVLALVAGIVGTSWEAAVARRERARAERRFNDVRKLANAFLFDFHDAIKDLPGSTPARKMVVQKALEYLDSLAREAHGDRSLVNEVANAYLRVGIVQGYSGDANLGDSAGALDSYRKGIALVEPLAATDSKSSQLRFTLARLYETLANVLAKTGDKTAASGYYRQSLDVCEELALLEARDAQVTRCRYIAHFALARLQKETGNLRGALAGFNEALRIYGTLRSEDQARPVFRNGLSVILGELGEIQQRLGNTFSALTSYREVEQIWESLVTGGPVNRLYRTNLSIVYVKEGEIFEELGQRPAALESYRKALAMREELHAVDPQEATAASLVASAHQYIADALEKSGDHINGLANCRRAQSIEEQLSRARRDSDDDRLLLSRTLATEARILQRMGRREASRRSMARALTIQRTLADRKDATTERLDAYARNLLTSEPVDLRNPSLALQYARRIVEMTQGNDPHYLDVLARAYFDTGDPQDAIATEQRAVASLPPIAPGQSVPAFRRDLEAHLAQFRTSPAGASASTLTRVVK